MFNLDNGFPVVWHYASSFFVFLFGFAVVAYIKKYFKTRLKISFLLYIWHSFFCIVNYFYAINYGSDSLRYYSTSLSSDISFGLGTDAIFFFTAILSSSFGLSLFGSFLIFNIFGSIGLIAFLGALKTIDSSHSKLILALVFLPSISFWSVGIGKDAIAFLSCNLMLWGVIHQFKKKYIIIIAVLLMFVVRPHIAILMSVAILIGVVLQSKSSTTSKIQISILLFSGLFFSIPTIMNYIGLNKATDLNEINNKISTMQGYYQGKGSGVDIKSMSAPEKLFSYIFRPLPYEARSITTLIASIENVFLLFIFIYYIRALYKTFFEKKFMALWVYIFFTWFILAFTTANLGIATRQKWMFTSLILFLIIYAADKYKKTRFK